VIIRKLALVAEVAAASIICAALVVGTIVPAHASVVYHVIAGAVTLGDGATSAGDHEVRVTATKYQNSTETISGWTDATGHYELVVPSNTYPSGKYYVSFDYQGAGAFADMEWPNMIAFQQGWLVDVAAGDRLDVSITLPGPQELSGTIFVGEPGVTGGTGEVEVRYQRALEDNAWSELSASVVTDANGRYEFPEVIPGFVRVRASYVGSGAFEDRWWTGVLYDPVGIGGQANLPLGSSGKTDADIVLPPRIDFSGAVRLGSDEHLASAGEIRVTVSTEDVEGTRVTRETTTDAAGRFAFDDLPQGGYRVSASDVDGGDWVATETMVNGLQFAPTLTHDIALVANTSIAGRVTDAYGGLTATVFADVYRADSIELLGTFETRSDASGAYRFDDLPDGVVALSFFDTAGWHAAMAWNGRDQYDYPDPIELVAGDHLTSLDARLPFAARIAGVVSGPGLTGEIGPSDIVVEVLVVDSESGSWIKTGDIYPVDTSGWFAVAFLPPRSYRLEVRYDGPRGLASVVTPTLTLAEGGDIAVYPQLPVPSLPRDTVKFIRALYSDFLEREPAQSEIQHWGGLLQGGFPRGSVASGFVTSDEYRLLRIDAAYRQILGRSSEFGGRMSWLNGMKAGTLTTDDIEQALFVSQEYFERKGGTNRLFVEALYADLLHRPASESEAAGWTADLDAGRTTRGQIISIFWRSLETARERVSIMYLKYFGRVAEYGSVVYWGDFNLAHGDSAVRSALTGSQEYWNVAQTRF
jgi:hypothetical protein